MGSRVAFSLQDRSPREGYIIGTGTEEFSFGHGGPRAPEALENIAISEVDFSTLEFFDNDECCWKRVVWDCGTQRWVVSKSAMR